MIKHQIIENFLPQEDFDKLQNAIVWDKYLRWQLHKGCCMKGDDEKAGSLWHWYGSHLVYGEGETGSKLFPLVNDLVIQPLVKKGVINQLIRSKCNFYPAWSEVREHVEHTDYPFNHSALLIGLNTCDGFTRLSEDTIIESVANRAVIFNGSIPHNPTNCTNAAGRFNININYI